MDDIQYRFLARLVELTASGQIEWARIEQDAGFVHALFRDELIVFELRGGKNAEFVAPNDQVEGVLCKCRNMSFLWLPGVEGWQELLDLLKATPVDLGKLRDMKKRAYANLPRALLEN